MHLDAFLALGAAAFLAVPALEDLALAGFTVTDPGHLLLEQTPLINMEPHVQNSVKLNHSFTNSITQKSHNYAWIADFIY